MGRNTMGPKRRRALLIVAGAHLGLVATGALKMHLAGDGWARRAIAEYRALSGAENSYTFFAPGVDAQLQPIFEVTDSSGGVITDVLERAVNVEVDLRVGNIKSLFWSEDEDFHRTVLGSWAGAMFTRHPEAERVVIRVEVFDLPSMAEYREGERPGWHLLEEASFSPQTAIRSVGVGGGGGANEAR